MYVMTLNEILGDDVTVEQVNGTLAVLGIGRRVRHHGNSGACFVHLREQIHDLLTVC